MQAKPLLSAQWSRLLKTILTHLVLAGGGLLMLVPFFWLVSSSLKAPHEIYVFPPQWIPDPPRWSNYAEVFDVVPVLTYTTNTLIVTILSTVGIAVSSSMAAYSLARLRFKGRNAVFAIILATLMLPFAATMIPVYVMFTRLGWVGTFLPLIVPAWFGAPITIFLLRQFFRTIPIELEDAARIDGAGEARIFFTMVLRLLAPAMVTVFLFIFVNTWNNFLLPLMMVSSDEIKPVTLGLYGMMSYFAPEKGAVMLGALLGVLPLIVLFFSLQRYWRAGLAAGAVKG